MSVPLNEDLAAKHVSDKAKRGYYRVVDSLSGGVGVDMRGKTAHDTHSYYMRGVIHHLDTKSYQVLQRYFAKRRFLTVLAKNLIEAGEYVELAREYDVTTEGFAQGGRPQKADSELAAALASMA
ncbi:MAG: hypothetical protein QMC36_03110 [Patescibacteria group bacterium]